MDKVMQWSHIFEKELNLKAGLHLLLCLAKKCESLYEHFSQQRISPHSVQRNSQSLIEKAVASDQHIKDVAHNIKQDEAKSQQNIQTSRRSTLDIQERQARPEDIQISLPSQSNSQPSGDLYSLLQQQNNITLLVQMQTSQFLPHREIPVFSGDPLQYKSFIKAFEHCVEAKANNKGHCLYYLEQFTRGQPRDLVRSCLHMTPERGYAVAKRLLQEHFGNALKVTAAYMEEIIGWPSVKSENVKGLQAYSLCLQECSNVVE